MGTSTRLTLARRLLEDYESRRAEWKHGRRCATGLASLDEALGGGMPLGSVCELVSSGEGVGAVDLALQMAGAVATSTRTIFLIDPQGDIYPPATEQAGIALRRLVIVRRLRWADAAWAMEQALRCSAVGAVVGLFGLSDARSARRLQLAAEAGGRIGLLVHGDTKGPAARFAALRMVVEATEVRATKAGARTSDEATKGERVVPTYIGIREQTGDTRDGARRVRVRVLKARMGALTDSFLVEFGGAAGDVRVHAVSGDGPAEVRRSATG